jgi:hypothetical protein
MKHNTLALINDNYKRLFRSLVAQLKNQGLTIIQATDGCYENLAVNKYTDILDIMEHCFSCEEWSLLVQDEYGSKARIAGHLDGCVESFINDYRILVTTEVDSVLDGFIEVKAEAGDIQGSIERATDSFNEINQDIELY